MENPYRVYHSALAQLKRTCKKGVERFWAQHDLTSRSKESTPHLSLDDPGSHPSFCCRNSGPYASSDGPLAPSAPQASLV